MGKEKQKILFLFSVLVTLNFQVLADEGDTIIIQTIDWDTPVLPGWNSPRSGIYQFPGDTVEFSKILMYYTLKCDPNQNPACGEWDYTTHTHIREHTGILDSNLYYHPNYLVNNISPDSFMYMDTESFYYRASLHYSNQTIPTTIGNVGQGGYTMDFEEGYMDGRSQFLYKADETNDAGILPGEITGLEINVETGHIAFKHLQIRVKHTSLEELDTDSLVNHGFKTVFKQHAQLVEGLNHFDFSFPFEWDGTSNLLIDWSWSDRSGSAELEADQLTADIANQSGNRDFYLDFEGWDFIEIPADVFSTIDSAITISFWQYGNPGIQPINSSIFEAVDSIGNRVLNIHLPWSNGRVYWDAGFDNGYDRIDRSAGDAENYKGKWNFWTFTKDLRGNGRMRMYLNGQLWFQGSGRYRPMDGILSCRIGSALTYDGYYAGMIDEVRIWDTLVEWDVIKEWMHKDIDSTHPNFNHLRAYYPFNNGSGLTVNDSSPNGFTGTQFGFPEWMSYRGENRFKNGLSNKLRPRIALENGNYDPALLDSVVVVDTFTHAPVNIVLFDPDDPPVPIDTLMKWPGYFNNYIYDEGGKAIDSTLVEPDDIIYHEDWPYYGEPFEIIVPWEIARFITPYGIGLNLGEGFTWVYDVTDYAPMLKDSVHITAGNFQELLDLKFYMVEGTPPREVKKIEKIYSGYWNLNNFPTSVPPDTILLIEEAASFKIKTRTSGHLFDNPTNCAEFCPKMHYLLIEEDTVYNWQILQECADNPLYPQGGTWIYDRAGWCPGAKVMEHDVEITPYITGDTLIVDYESQPDEYGAYSLEVQLFSYDEPNFNIDIAVDEIISQNILKRYSRFNPSGSAPIIVIRNQGTDTVTDIKIDYGPIGSNKSFEWTGQLAFMEKDTVILESFEWEEWIEGNGRFKVSLTEPNGELDENLTNNDFISQYELPPVYPSTFVIHFKTNKTAYQNSYEILTNEGLQIFEKTAFEPETLYIDTITLFNDCYDFYLWDSGDNGISFWANNEGNGYLKFFDLEGDQIIRFNGDFGDRIYHSFYTDLYLDDQPYADNQFSFDIIPNPSNGLFSISYSVSTKNLFEIKIFNSSGQPVWNTICGGKNAGIINLNLSENPAGIYHCVININERAYNKKFIIY